MDVLTANNEQYNSLNGYSNGFAKLEFIQDKNDRWIVGLGVLTDPNFEAIRTELNELERIPFEPKEPEIILDNELYPPSN
jgi:hypothetical protein